MSDLQINNTQVNGDTFERLAADTTYFIASTIAALAELATIEDATAEEIQTGLLIMATVGREIGVKFAERGIVLTGGTVPSNVLIESDTEAYNVY